jgi:hypothetical protein
MHLSTSSDVQGLMPLIVPAHHEVPGRGGEADTRGAHAPHQSRPCGVERPMTGILVAGTARSGTQGVSVLATRKPTSLSWRSDEFRPRSAERRPLAELQEPPWRTRKLQSPNLAAEHPGGGLPCSRSSATGRQGSWHHLLAIASVSGPDCGPHNCGGRKPAFSCGSSKPLLSCFVWRGVDHHAQGHGQAW